MAMIKPLLAELDHEAAVTRRLLERAPEERYDWQPHEKSMTLGRLTGHIAELLRWGDVILNRKEFDFAAPSDFVAKTPTTRDDLLGFYDGNLARLRKALEASDDQTLLERWKLRSGDKIYMDLPRVAVLRTMLFSHIIHHRGQLAVYLRLLDVPVPAIYGPSADDRGDFG